jgi:hypothetical protein
LIRIAASYPTETIFTLLSIIKSFPPIRCFTVIPSKYAPGYFDCVDVIEVEKARYTKFLLNIRGPSSVAAPLDIAGAWQSEELGFNVEVDLCCGAVLGYVLAV